MSIRLSPGGHIILGEAIWRRTFPVYSIRGSYTLINLDPEPGVLKTFTRVYIRGAQVNPEGQMLFPNPTQWFLDLRVDDTTWLTFTPNVDYHNQDYYMEFLVNDLIGYSIDLRVRYEADFGYPSNQTLQYGTMTAPIIIDYEPSGARNWR